MALKNLDSELKLFIDSYLQQFEWTNSGMLSASASIETEEDGCISADLMSVISRAIIKSDETEFCLTINIKRKKLILYYID